MLFARMCDRTFEGFPFRVVCRSTFHFFDIRKHLSKKMRFISLFQYVKDLSTPFSVLHHALYLRSSIYPSIIYANGTNLCPIKGSIYWTSFD